jgi:hypothetical protein
MMWLWKRVKRWWSGPPPKQFYGNPDNPNLSEVEYLRMDDLLTRIGRTAILRNMEERKKFPNYLPKYRGGRE